MLIVCKRGRMIFTETLPNNRDTWFEMKQLCSSWEQVASKKMAEHETSCAILFKRYVASKSVCEFSFYRFRKFQQKSLREYSVDIAHDDRLNLLGFSLSKIITIQDTANTKSYRFLFLNYLTADPNQFESSNRIKNVGDVILKRLEKRCIEQDLDGIFSEPVRSAMPFFHARKFIDTELKRDHRSALVLLRADFAERGSLN